MVSDRSATPSERDARPGPLTFNRWSAHESPCPAASERIAARIASSGLDRKCYGHHRIDMWSIHLAQTADERVQNLTAIKVASLANPDSSAS
jgi:hypothetical protein